MKSRFARCLMAGGFFVFSGCVPFSGPARADLVPHVPPEEQVQADRDVGSREAFRWVLVGQPSRRDREVLGRHGDLRDTLAVYFSDSAELADYAYGIAVFTGDVRPDMPKDKFRKGVSGCHYSAEQVVAWANRQVLGGRTETEPLLRLLLDEGALARQGNWYWAAPSFRHLLMVANGKSRSLEDNIVHEKLHIRFDQDPDFRRAVREAWDALPEAERERFMASIPSYNRDNPDQIIEEWGVRTHEKALKAAGKPAR